MPNSKARAVTPKVALEERLPDLVLAQSRTNSSAIHRIDYIGPLTPWPDFHENVETSFRNYRGWRKRQLDLRPIGQPKPHSLLKEHVRVANELGVQGRWQQHIGQVMSGVFQAQDHQLTFTDFNAAGIQYIKRPDLILMDNTPATLIVGELKTPWVSDHILENRMADVDGFRRALGMYFGGPPSACWPPEIPTRRLFRSFSSITPQ